MTCKMWLYHSPIGINQNKLNLIELNLWAPSQDRSSPGSRIHKKSVLLLKFVYRTNPYLFWTISFFYFRQKEIISKCFLKHTSNLLHFWWRVIKCGMGVKNARIAIGQSQGQTKENIAAYREIKDEGEVKDQMCVRNQNSDSYNDNPWMYIFGIFFSQTFSFSRVQKCMHYCDVFNLNRKLSLVD